MPAKKYFEGMELGPKKILFIKDLGYINGRKKGIFKCPICEEKWETGLYDVVSGKSSKCIKCRKEEDSKRIIQMNKDNSLNLTNQIFGMLKALEDTQKIDNTGHHIWKCQCQCENKTICYYNSSQLKEKRVLHCGCQSKRSKGEILIMQILKELNIPFEQEYKFEDCINPKTNCKLRFDFYLPNHNILIEYDGMQHYKDSSVSFFKRDSLEERKFRDEIKNNWCKQKGYKLIRIPYSDYNLLNKDYLFKLIGSN